MLMQNSRSKRPHSDVDDCDECLPISKRINSLNLEGQRKSLDEQSACAQQQMTSQGASSNTQLLSPQWAGNMLPHQTPFPAQYQPADQYQPASQYQPGPCTPTYQSLSPEQLASAEQLRLVQTVGVGVSPSHSPPFPGQPFSRTSHLEAPHFPPPPHLGFQGVGGEMGVDGGGLSYDPELGERENPHYYHINHLLFMAHCQRSRREGFPLDSGPTSFS